MTEQLALDLAPPDQTEGQLTVADCDEWLADVRGRAVGTGFWPGEWVQAEAQRIAGIDLSGRFEAATLTRHIAHIRKLLVLGLTEGDNRG